jgi:hypothetical protein
VGGSAISDGRILADDGRTVVIRVKNYREGGRFEPLTMTGEEFVRRFLLHILPRRMHRLHYGGLFSPQGRKQRLSLARQRISEQNLSLSPTLIPQRETIADPVPPQLHNSQPRSTHAPPLPAAQSQDHEQLTTDEVPADDAQQEAPRAYTPTCPRCQLPGMQPVGHFTARQLATFLVQLQLFWHSVTSVMLTLPFESAGARHAPQLLGDASGWLTFTLTTLDAEVLSYCDTPPPDT